MTDVLAGDDILAAHMQDHETRIDRLETVSWQVQDTAGTTTSAAYVAALTGGTELSTTAVVPASGRVEITVGGLVANSTHSAYLSYQIVGSVSGLIAADDDWALAKSSGTAIGAIRSWVHTGLTAGETVTVTAMHRTASGGTSSYEHRTLTIRPA